MLKIFPKALSRKGAHTKTLKNMCLLAVNGGKHEEMYNVTQ